MTKNNKEDRMYIRVLKDGDKVLSVSSNFIAISRKNGEVDLIPISFDENAMLRVLTDKIVTIGYGDNVVEVRKGTAKYETF